MEKARLKLNWLSSFVLGIACLPSAHAMGGFVPKQFLLDQVLLGEANYKDDLVQQSLSRLELIDPDDPRVVAARLRLALRQGHQALAEEQLKKLKQLAPHSEIYQQAQVSMFLAQPQGQQKLQQARVYAMAGRVLEAKMRYDVLFHGNPPTPELAVEYWTLVSRIPDQQDNAFQHLFALYQFLKKHQVIKEKDNAAEWENALLQVLSRLSTIQGNKALKQGDLAVAQQKFMQAHHFDNKNAFSEIGLGDVAFKRKDFKQAETAYQRALKLSPYEIFAVNGLIDIYQKQSLEKAINYIKTLPLSKQAELKGTITYLQSNQYQQQAEQYEKTGHFLAALEKYRLAKKIDADNIWVTYHLAKLLYKLGKGVEANRLFHQLKEKQKKSPELIYAYALFLSSIDKDPQALSVLNTLPVVRWSQSMRELAHRLHSELVFEYADALRDKGNKQAAKAYLLKQTQSVDTRLTLAGWALEDGSYYDALVYYKEAGHMAPQNFDAKLGEIDALIALNRKEEARQLLNSLSFIKAKQSINSLRKIANAWGEVGELNRSDLMYQQIKKRALQQAPGQETALVFRDAARVEQQLGEAKKALADYREAMLKSEITAIYPQTDLLFTRLTRNNPNDDWLKRSVRSDAAKLFHQQETRVTLEQDYWRLNGTPGVSDQTIADNIAQVDMPFHGGRLFFRGDYVRVNAGRFETENGVYFDDFGTCGVFGCSTGAHQVQTGYNAAVGWQNDRWVVDMGFSPAGFPVMNWLGGVSYSGDFHHVGWTLGWGRRPMSNSLLSFSGTQDPHTGVIWGGVVSSGPSLSLSYDRGEAHGVWANLAAERLTGQNVANNARVRLMDGYYYKIINEDNKRLSVGVNNMIWHYQKDLSGYTLGQGGYYSPQQFLSFALPVNYRRRTDYWSYELGGSVTWARATTGNNFLYPLPNLIPELPSDENPFSPASTSSGMGYTLLALAERRVTPHFVIGAVVDIQRARDFTPSHASLYVRYNLEAWDGDMDMPIRPVVPYGNYR